MQRRQVTVGNLAAANAALLAAAQTPGAGALFTLTGSQPDAPRRVLLTYGNEAGARTVVLSGLGWEGCPQSETLAVPSGAPGVVLSALDYTSVTSALSGGGAWSANASIGTYAGGAAGPAQASAWVAVDPWGRPETSLQIDVAGTINCTVQETLDDPNLSANPNYLVQPPSPANVVWVNHPDAALVGFTLTVQGNLAYPVSFCRLLVNSYTAGAGNNAVMTVEQAGNLR